MSETDILNQYGNDNGMISYPVGIGKTMKIDHNGVRMLTSGLAEATSNETKEYLLLNNENNLECLENLVTKTVNNLSNDQCVSSIPIIQSNTSIDALHNNINLQNIDARNGSTIIQKYTNILNNDSNINVENNPLNFQKPESSFDNNEATNLLQKQIQHCPLTAQQQLQRPIQEQYNLV